MYTTLHYKVRLFLSTRNVKGMAVFSEEVQPQQTSVQIVSADAEQRMSISIQYGNYTSIYLQFVSRNIRLRGEK